MNNKHFDLKSYLKSVMESDHKTITLEPEAIEELAYTSALLQEKTGFFLILLEGKPFMYTPPTEFAIWVDDFDKTYQIDVPNKLFKDEVIALYEELEELEDIYEMKLM